MHKTARVTLLALACLSMFGLAFMTWAWGIVLMQAFNGAGDTITPTYINLFAFWIFQIPLAYLLGLRFSFGLKGTFFAVPVADAVFAITALVLFRRGRWKLQRI